MLIQTGTWVGSIRMWAAPPVRRLVSRSVAAGASQPGPETARRFQPVPRNQPACNSRAEKYWLPSSRDERTSGPVTRLDGRPNPGDADPLAGQPRDASQPGGAKHVIDLLFTMSPSVQIDWHWRSTDPAPSGTCVAVDAVLAPTPDPRQPGTPGQHRARRDQRTPCHRWFWGRRLAPCRQ